MSNLLRNASNEIKRQLPRIRDDGQRPLVSLTFEAWDAILEILGPGSDLLTSDPLKHDPSVLSALETSTAMLEHYFKHSPYQVEGTKKVIDQARSAARQIR